jgi:hypothetical protein
MSASIENTVVATKVKKVTLSAQSTKFMVFGNWLIERLVSDGQLTAESVTESRKTLGMFSGVDEQIVLYDGFAADLKVHTKNVKALIRANNKPPTKAKAAKAVGDADKKRGRKKNAVAEQDPMLALNEQLVAAAQSDEPIAKQPDYVRAPKEPEVAAKPEEEEAEPKKKELKKKKVIAAKPQEATEPKKVDDAAKPQEETEPKKKVDAVDKKAAKEAEKVAAKAAKDAEKAAEKAAKEAEKAAKEADKAAAKAAKEATKKGAKSTPLEVPVLKRTSATPEDAKPASDEEEEEELECEVFTHEGVEYLIDHNNCIYDRNTQLPIGTFDATAKVINMN